jgi:hypothetical protein
MNSTCCYIQPPGVAQGFAGLFHEPQQPWSENSVSADCPGACPPPPHLPAWRVDVDRWRASVRPNAATPAHAPIGRAVRTHRLGIAYTLTLEQARTQTVRSRHARLHDDPQAARPCGSTRRSLAKAAKSPRRHGRAAVVSTKRKLYQRFRIGYHPAVRLSTAQGAGVPQHSRPIDS